MPAEIRPPKILTPKNANCSSFTLVLESIIPTIRPGVLRDDESNGEGLMREFQGRNSKFSDGGTPDEKSVVLNYKLKFSPKETFEKTI